MSHPCNFSNRHVSSLQNLFCVSLGGYTACCTSRSGGIAHRGMVPNCHNESPPTKDHRSSSESSRRPWKSLPKILGINHTKVRMELQRLALLKDVAGGRPTITTSHSLFPFWPPQKTDGPWRATLWLNLNSCSHRLGLTSRTHCRLLITFYAALYVQKFSFPWHFVFAMTRCHL